MKSDTQLQKEVIAELNWDPSINAAQIGVQVKDGIVTLSGNVDKYSTKRAAERAVQKINGVIAMAEEIEVILPGTSSRTDADIARTAESILEWTTNWPKDHLKVIVENGWITISGILDFAYQKQLATNSVRHLIGVKGVSNQIVIKETLTSNIVKSDIEAVLKRRALKDSKEIKVSVEGGKVTLTGVVHSWSEREIVSDSVWSTPGVTDVKDYISVAY